MAIVIDGSAGINFPNIGRRNWIINGDFQVSQRGDYTTSPVLVTGDNYSVDRWQHAGFSNHTIQVVNGYLRQESTLAGSNNFYTQQKVENFGKRFNGQTVTVSGKCNTNSSNVRLWVFQGSAWTIIGNITGDFSFTFQYTKQDGYDHMGLRFGLSDVSSPNVATTTTVGEYFELSEVQLELGSVSTPFEHRSYGEELALCQRYYEKGSFKMYNAGIGSCAAGINYKVTKRAAPAMSYGTSNSRLYPPSSTEWVEAESFGFFRSGGELAFTWTAESEL